jgi:hypothetical protein
MFLRDLNRLLSVFRFVIIETWWAVRERNMVTQWDEDRSPVLLISSSASLAALKAMNNESL